MKIVRPFTILRWTVFCFWGWLLGVVLVLLLSAALDSAGFEHFQFYVGTGMAAGLGFSQWIFLRRYKPIGLSWIWISIAGMTIPFLLVDLFAGEIISDKLAYGIIPGAALTSLLQFLLLKNHSGNARTWIWFSFLAWILALIATAIIEYTMKWRAAGHSNLLLAILNLILILSGGIFYGSISGIAMKRILK